VRPSASEVDRLWADSALAREILGWAPQTDLDDGLRQTIAWVEANEDYYGFAGYHR
jgi:dTDP-glucose 4,6-dehydratase